MRANGEAVESAADDIESAAYELADNEDESLGMDDLMDMARSIVEDNEPELE